jgi:hypothetical protein
MMHKWSYVMNRYLGYKIKISTKIKSYILIRAELRYRLFYGTIKNGGIFSGFSTTLASPMSAYPLTIYDPFYDPSSPSPLPTFLM